MNLKLTRPSKFSFNVNDNLLAQNTLNEIIQHPNIANKNEYKNY